MKNKIFLWIILEITAFVLLVMLLTNVVVEPWIGEKIETSVNEKSGDYQLKMEKVQVIILRSGIELENITLQPKPENEGQSGLTGDIVYSEHAEKAIEKGSISFNEIDATIYKITNDTIYKTEKAYLEWYANALLMGKGKLSILLKARIFDNQNTFALNGTLSEMKVSELNPVLEKSAFITVMSGKINTMDFSLSANNTKATGNLKLLYEGLDFAVIDKQTGETDAIIEQIKSVIANIIVMESNPMPGEEVRPGIIEYERDPEKFLFSYVAKALMPGMKTSITK